MKSPVFTLLLLAGAASAEVGRSATTNVAACAIIATDGTDGPAASPENHTVLFENVDVRVLDVRSRPHTREAIHTHARPAVMYVDRQGAGTYRTPDNSRTESHPTNPAFKPRIFTTKPEGPHWTENTGDVPFHAIRVEFKHPGCGLRGWHPAAPGPDDAAVADPGAYTLLLETADVRVTDVYAPPHGREPMHSDPWPGVFYIVQGASVRYVDSDGKSEVRTFPPNGQVIGARSVENLSDTPLHLIRFELKYGTPAP